MADSISGTNTGRITSVDNTFYQGGKKATMDMMLMGVMVKRVEATDQLMGGLLSEMQAGNVKTNQLNDLRNNIATIRPTDASGTVSHADVMAVFNKIKAKDHVDPIKDWGIVVPDGDLTQTQIDAITESIKSQISSVNSNQQMTQIKIEKYTNVRNESMQLVSSMIKTVNDILQSIMRNM